MIIAQKNRSPKSTMLSTSNIACNKFKFVPELLNSSKIKQQNNSKENNRKLSNRKPKQKFNSISIMRNVRQNAISVWKLLNIILRWGMLMKYWCLKGLIMLSCCTIIWINWINNSFARKMIVRFKITWLLEGFLILAGSSQRQILIVV